MTVEELLQLPTIKGLKLISGNLGVHREISTVTVVDTPDGFQWLKGNEVVITTTYALEKTPNSFLDFISKLLSRNISALIVKSDRYIKVIPENAKKLCDEKALPLIYSTVRQSTHLPTLSIQPCPELYPNRRSS